MNLSSKTTEAGRPARSLNYNHEDVDANCIGCGEGKGIKGTTGLCDHLGVGNVTRAGVTDLKAILILETGWLELP